MRQRKLEKAGLFPSPPFPITHILSPDDSDLFYAFRTCFLVKEKDAYLEHTISISIRAHGIHI